MADADPGGDGRPSPAAPEAGGGPRAPDAARIVRFFVLKAALAVALMAALALAAVLALMP